MDDDPHHGVEQHVEGIEDSVVVEGQGVPVLHACTSCSRRWRRESRQLVGTRKQ